MTWLKDRSLTIVLMLLFMMFWGGQAVVGWREYNQTQQDHERNAITLTDYLRTGHMWEATFENWESEFLQMAAFILLTTLLVQKGSPESRRPGVIELVDVDPRRFADPPGAPGPVRKGGLILWLYERSLGMNLGLAVCHRANRPCNWRLARVRGGTSRAQSTRAQPPGLRHLLTILV